MPFNLFEQPVSREGILGCSQCPLDKMPGVNKVKRLERIKGRKGFLWAQSPDGHENAKRIELVGPTGTFLWDTMKLSGLSREEFDVNNVLRCQPLGTDGEEHEPTKRELQCCSPYNDEALRLNAGRAAVHVILGDVAGNQLLGKNFKKDKPIFWFPPWDCYVVLSWHPSYIYQQGGVQAGWEYFTWRDRFRAVRAILDHPGRWGYVKAQNYTTVRTLAEFDEMERILRTEQRQHRRVSFDIEDDVVDGKRLLLLAGFGTGHYQNPKDFSSWTGRCFSVVVDHPQSGYEPTHLSEIRKRVAKLVADHDLKKSLQNGSYDSDVCIETIRVPLRGYSYDTQYGTYLRYSFLRSCSLENLTYRFFPEFCDYKSTVDEWSGHFADAPIDRLSLRNSGDCDITQRLEQRFSSQVSQPLVEVYIHAGKTLDRMETRGPRLDWPNWKKAMEIVPEMIEKLDRQLQQISGDPNFNCNAPEQVAKLIYDVLQLPQGDEGRSTQKDVLRLLQAETQNNTLDIVLKRRSLGVIKSTFLKGYETGARLYDGELRTIWWLTGAITGRLRSGKGDRAEAEGITNFQNLHGNILLQNLLIADEDWRQAL
jgi:uracil-DNA glycosylase family 4